MAHPPLSGLRLIGPIGALLIAILFSGPVPAFSNVAIGATLDNATLPSLAGEPRAFLGDSVVNAFVFFRPGQEHSKEVLGQLQRLKNKLGDRPVYWSAIVSDTYPRDAVELLVKAVGLDMPVLIDAGDALYGRLGVILHPVVGIADGEHRLQAYIPYHRLNFSVIVEAHIRYLLGDIDEARLRRILAPKAAVNGGHKAVAKRNLNMAKMLYKMGRRDDALAAARKSASLDADLADAHAVVGAILAQRGDCAGARPSIDRALELDPHNATAVAADKACRASP